MLTLSRLFPSLTVAGFLAACGGNNDVTPATNQPTQSNNLVTLNATANGAQQVPETASDPSATGIVTLDDSSGAVTGSFTVSGVAPTAAHIHDGFAGTNGAVVVTLDIAGITLSVPAGTVLDAGQMALLRAGGYYLNVHSSAFPDGEIRGQITPPDISTLLVGLAGENEVPIADTSAMGTAYLTINTSTGAATINVRTTDLSTPTAAHLHREFAGANGPPVTTLTQDANQLGFFTSASGTVLDTAALANLRAGGTYVNVHTEENPDGELRGQVLPEGISLLVARISGAQAVPPVSNGTSGKAYVTLNENALTLTANASINSADTATDAHIHSGAPGTTGAILIPLTQSGTEPGSWNAPPVAVTADVAAAVKAGETYIDVHLPATDGLQTRGQILP